MNKIIFLLVPFLLTSVLVSAEWWCGGQEFYDCPSEAPGECCINDVSMCLYSTQDCSQYCAIKDGGDTWDDYWFCNVGSIVSCNVQSPYQNNMVCCPTSVPVWNEQYQQCWQEGWECTNNNQCNSPDQCIANICECVPAWDCGAWGQCSNMEQSRTCVDGCNHMKVEKQSCEPDQCNFPSDCTSWCRTHSCAKGQEPGEWDCVSSKCSWLYTPVDNETDGDGTDGGDHRIVRPDLIDFIIIVITFVVLAIVWVI